MIIILASWESIKNVLTLILAFAFVLVLAYYGAKITAKYQGNMLNNKSNIKIVESFRVGGNKIIAIAKIGKSYYALGIGKEEINLIDKIELDDMIDFNVSNNATNNGKIDFKSIFAQARKKETENINSEETQDDFFE